MTPQMSQITDDNLQAEIDPLTYSAYLLTLDPEKAFSAVVTATDGSPSIFGRCKMSRAQRVV
jgi:hypothetical protein